MSDWVSAAEVADLVERERTQVRGGSPAPGPTLTAEEAGYRFACVAAFGRWVEALDATFGPDAWPSSWAGVAWQWETTAGGPDADLVAAVSVRRP